MKELTQELTNSLAECKAYNGKAYADYQRKLVACYDNRASDVDSWQETFDPLTFGIFSSYLENSNLVVSEYTYKDAKTLLKRSEFVIQDHTHAIEVWSQLSEKNYTSFPTFGGYENNLMYPTSLAKLNADWKDSDSYTNKEGMKFFYAYDYAPRSIGSVSMYHFSKYSPMAHPILVRIQCPTFDLESSSTTTVVTDAKDRCQQIADSISIKL